jgi:hypothetical protein
MAKKIVSKKAPSVPAVGPDPAVIAALASNPTALGIYMQAFSAQVTPVAPSKKTLEVPKAPVHEGVELKYLDYFVIPDELFVRLTVTPKGGVKEEWNPSSYNRGGFFGYQQWLEARDAYYVSPVRKEHRAWLLANGMKPRA